METLFISCAGALGRSWNLFIEIYSASPCSMTVWVCSNSANFISCCQSIHTVWKTNMNLSSVTILNNKGRSVIECGLIENSEPKSPCNIMKCFKVFFSKR